MPSPKPYGDAELPRRGRSTPPGEGRPTTPGPFTRAEGPSVRGPARAGERSGWIEETEA